VTFRRRTYPEVLDNLLTAVIAGAAAEAHPFPPAGGGPPYVHNLERPPAADVLSIYGSRDGASHLFRKGADYALADDGATLGWLPGGDLPDAGTLFAVNYLPAAAQPVLTDVETGSVVRTLSESIALEVARVYAELEGVYRSGFVDTAEGSALDNVVALLGLERVAAGRASGELELARAAGSRGTITVPAGTRVITADGSVEYETTATVSLADGQGKVRAPVRDRGTDDPLAADALTVLPVPLAGVAAVTNPAPTAFSNRDESDDELRARAKGFLHGSERATLGALREAIARQGLKADLAEVGPGVVEVTPQADVIPPDQLQRLLTAIEEVRPAGVTVRLLGAQPPARVDLSLRLTTRDGLLERDLRAVQRSVREKVADYFDRLPTREPASVNRLVGLVLSVPEVEDVQLVGASVDTGAGPTPLDVSGGQLALGGVPTALGDLDLADPALPTLLDLVVAFPAGEDPPDAAAVRAALEGAAAYLNGINGSAIAAGLADADRQREEARRTLSFGKLLALLPLPGKPGTPLDQLAAADPAPPLPAAADPYRVELAVSQHGGLSRRLRAPADAYALTPFERLAVNAVEVARDGGG
jgi:Baseplate J-like protein